MFLDRWHHRSTTLQKNGGIDSGSPAGRAEGGDGGNVAEYDNRNDERQRFARGDGGILGGHETAQPGPTGK
jgi:hypothetical protein